MKRFDRLAAACSVALLLAACSGGGTSGSTVSPPPPPPPPPAGVAGITLPEEVSALPTSSASPAGPVMARLTPSLTVLPGAGTDYDKAVTMKWVDERALSQFDILNTIMKAVGQTHYADAENVNTGAAYGAVVGWEEDRGDGSSKQLKTWTVKSDMVDGVNVVKVWMENMMQDNPAAVVTAELHISQAPTRNDDGSYADYGAWTLEAAIPGPGGIRQGFFAASAVNAVDGSLVMIQQNDNKGQGAGPATRGILHKSATAGYGKVEYPDYKSCQSPSCIPPTVTTAYAYDGSTVALQAAGGNVVVKDRSHPVDMVNRYGLYDAATGADVRASHTFGFPIRVDLGGGQMSWGNYGAWQGRHQVWANGNSLDADVVVTRADVPPIGAPTYTTSRAFTGTLVHRTLVAADLADLAGLVVETWVNRNFQLSFDGTTWTDCVNGNWAPSPPSAPGQPPGPPVFTCGSGSAPFSDWTSLVVNPADTRHMVNINAPPANPQPGQNPQPTNLCYLAGSSPPAFTLANMSPGGAMSCTGTAYPIVGPQQLWINVGGPIYVEFDGSGWVQKTVASFDQSTSTPTFDPSGDVSYTLELNRQYYINNPGGNYVVTSTSSGTTVQIELQSVANPVDATVLAGANPVFQQAWMGTGGSTFRFVTDATSANFMKLVYDTVGANDQNKSPAPVADEPVTSGLWGLVLASAPSGDQYNWDYPMGCQNCGTQQYLLSGASYLLLDSPIRLAPLTLGARNFSLQFDGNWVNGLPDIYRDLQQNGWTVTQAIADKLVTIPAGTEVVDALDTATHYFFKPLQVCEYLPVIASPATSPDLSQASALSLSGVPALRVPEIGAKPSVSVKYSEGKLVQ
jgi:hypothetical protein